MDPYGGMLSLQFQKPLWPVEGVEDRDRAHPTPPGEGKGEAAERL